MLVKKPLTGFQEYAPEEMLERSQAFAANLKRRRTVRDFSGRTVDRRLIEAVIDSAGTAPSGANHQPWHFVVIEDPDKRRRLREAADFISQSTRPAARSTS